MTAAGAREMPPASEQLVTRTYPVTRAVASGAVFAIAAAIVLSFLYAAIVFRHRLPSSGDYWGFLEVVAESSHWLAAVWQQHGEHRVALPRILILLDQAWSHGSGIVTTIAALGAHILSVAIVLWFAARELNDRFGWAVLAASTAVLFFAWHLEVFTNPYAVWVPLIFFAVVLALACLVKATSSWPSARARLWLATSVIMGVAATFTSAAGLFVWGALMFTALLVRARLIIVLVLILAATMAGAAYFAGYSAYSYSGVSIWAHLSDPLRILGQLGVLFGAPVAYVHVPAGMTVGLCAVSLALGLVVLQLGRRPTELQALCAGILSFCLIVSVGIIFYRTREGSGWLIVHRYGTIMLWLWAGVLVLAATRLASCNGFKTLVPPLVALSLLVLLVAHVFASARAHAKHLLVEATRYAIVAGVVDPELEAQWSYSSALGAIRDHRRRHGLSPFDSPLAKAVGDRAHISDPPQETCAGRVVVTESLAGPSGGVRLNVSWTFPGATAVGVLDSSGALIGLLGRLHPPLVDSWVRLGPLDRDNAWFGYAATAAGRPYQLVGFAADGRLLCQFP